jgi:hypothetical protein
VSGGIFEWLQLKIDKRSIRVRTGSAADWRARLVRRECGRLRNITAVSSQFLESGISAGNSLSVTFHLTARRYYLTIPDVKKKRPAL